MMPGVLHQFVSELDRARKELRRGGSKQLHSQRRRDELRGLVEKYFTEIRPKIYTESEQDEDVATVDQTMQDLLVQCHKRGSVKLYMTLLAKVRKALITVDARVISTPRYTSHQQALHSIDMMIFSTLDKIVPSAALSYRQALYDLEAQTRYSWRGPATDLREALRETLDHLAPDKEVEEMPGYRSELNTSGPTMKQKVRYIMKNRGISKSISAPAENATESIETAVGSFVRSVYTRSSISTHTPTEKSEVVRIRDFVRVVLCELLEIRV